MGRPVDRRCNVYGCSRLLTTIPEMIAGICNAHFEKLQLEDYFAGICWNCGRITAVGNREGIVKDKYIFSKGCRLCTGNEEMNISWMTIKGESSPVTEVIEVKDEITGKKKAVLVPIGDQVSYLTRLKSGNSVRVKPKQSVRPFIW